ncbi:MAG: ribonuclease III [Bacteroidaceae bacterium]|nr:ribonuclease III [Bacteroidaceae bacterium]
MILVDYIYYLLTPDKQFCRELKHLLGFFPHHTDIYREAFRHRSMAGRESEEKSRNNERLEYLGDAVLGSVAAEILYKHFPEKHEGFLTQARSAIVQRHTLNRIANEIGINALVKTSVGNVTHNSYLLGNAFEALIGAICIDRGYKYCYRFIEQEVLGKLVSLDTLAVENTNYKSQLLELCQKHQYPVEFTIINETVIDGSPLFESEVSICGILVSSGKGFTKKESHQQAAQQALRILRRNKAVRQEIEEAAKKYSENPLPADAEPSTPTTEKEPFGEPSEAS